MNKKLILISSWILGAAATAGPVSRIEHPSRAFAGKDTVAFPPGTTLELPSTLPYTLVLKEYQGEWKNGVASGAGELKGEFVQPQTDNPLYKDLHSPQPAIRAQALTVLERARADAKFLGGDPDEAERQLLGAKSTSISLRGEFSEGTAAGPGELTAPGRSLKANFVRWLPEGLGTHIFEGRAVVSEMFTHGLPANGPVVIQQYGFPTGAPTHTFVGTVDAGKLSGDWYELPWRGGADGFTYSALGPETVLVSPDGEVMTCYYDRDWMKTSAGTDLAAIRGNIDMLVLRSSDLTYVTAAKRCQIRTKNGWTLAFAVAGTPPFAKHAPPYTCADAQGTPGVFSWQNGDPFCTVTTTEYRWGTALWRRIEKAVRTAYDDFFDAINGATDKVLVDTVCGIVQKPDRKGCNINVSMGVTFDIPDTAEKQRQRAEEELRRYLEARKKLEDGLTANGPADPAMKSGLAAYGACSDACLAPGQAFSKRAVEEIWHSTKLSLDEDAKRYRIASLVGDAWNLISTWIPFYEAATATSAGIQLESTIERSIAYVDGLPEGPAKWMASRYAYSLKDRYGSKIPATVGVAWAKAMESTMESVVFSKITGLTNDQQLAIAIGFETSRPAEFFREERDIKSVEDLVRRLINKRFKEYGIAPMPPEEPSK